MGFFENRKMKKAEAKMVDLYLRVEAIGLELQSQYPAAEEKPVPELLPYFNLPLPESYRQYPVAAFWHGIPAGLQNFYPSDERKNSYLRSNFCCDELWKPFYDIVGSLGNYMRSFVVWMPYELLTETERKFVRDFRKEMGFCGDEAYDKPVAVLSPFKDEQLPWVGMSLDKYRRMYKILSHILDEFYQLVKIANRNAPGTAETDHPITLEYVVCHTSYAQAYMIVLDRMVELLATTKEQYKESWDQIFLPNTSLSREMDTFIDQPYAFDLYGDSRDRRFQKKEPAKIFMNGELLNV